VVGAVAVAAGLLLVARRPATVSFPRGVLAVLPVCVFVVQEHLEYLLGHGSRPWTVSLHWCFLVGLAIQVPLVLAAYATARLLVRVAVRVLGRGTADVPARRTILAVRVPSAPALLTRARPLGDARFNRGPPIPAV